MNHIGFKPGEYEQTMIQKENETPVFCPTMIFIGQLVVE